LFSTRIAPLVTVRIKGGNRPPQKEISMSRYRLLASAVLIAALGSVYAQQPADASHPHDVSAVAVAPVERHLAMLSEKLELTADQQERTRPILQRMHDNSQATENDESISSQERKERMHAEMMRADRELRVILTDEQKKKLDVLEQQMHPGNAAPQQHP
jgi:Spy/CpxP family protein refolding chaperone